MKLLLAFQIILYHAIENKSNPIISQKVIILIMQLIVPILHRAIIVVCSNHRNCVSHYSYVLLAEMYYAIIYYAIYG